MASQKKKKQSDILSDKDAYRELSAVQNAWITYLLVRLGENYVHVKKDDISKLIGKTAVNTYSVGDEYVIEIASSKDLDG